MSNSQDHGLCMCTSEVYRMRTVEDETRGKYGAGIPTSSQVPWRAGVVEAAAAQWERNECRFLEANIRGFEFHKHINIYLKNSELLKFSRQHVDKTVVLNDQNCFWRSICSEETVHSRFFSAGRIGFRSHFWWALNVHDLFVTRPFFWLDCSVTFFENYEQRIFASKNWACRTSPPVSSCV